jgi:hypothetical protein
MKTALLLLVGISVLVSGCWTLRASPKFDLASDFTITVFDGERRLSVSEEDQATLRRMFRFWLPKMRTASTTYPTPTGRLGVTGTDPTGARYEGVIFVGSNWIGDGHGVVTLADTEVFKLSKIMKRATANQTPEPMRAKGPHGSS